MMCDNFLRYGIRGSTILPSPTLYQPLHERKFKTSGHRSQHQAQTEHHHNISTNLTSVSHHFSYVLY
jgi:hypothetical protein